MYFHKRSYNPKRSTFTKNIFKPAAIVAFRRSNNLTNFLVRAKLRKPFTKNTPPPPPWEVLFNVLVIVLRAPTYPTDLLLTHSTPKAKGDPAFLTTLSATQKTSVYMIRCKRCHKQYIRDWLKASTNTADQLTSSPTYPNLARYQNISPLIITPLMTSHPFH